MCGLWRPSSRRRQIPSPQTAQQDSCYSAHSPGYQCCESTALSCNLLKKYIFIIATLNRAYTRFILILCTYQVWEESGGFSVCHFFWSFFFQNATAWRCFTLSKQPVPVACEAPQQAGDLTPVSSSSVMNHVMHGSYGEVGLCRNASAPSSVVRRETFVYLRSSKVITCHALTSMFQCPYFVLPSLDNFHSPLSQSPESLMVWVHFKAPQKYISSGNQSCRISSIFQCNV